ARPSIELPLEQAQCEKRRVALVEVIVHLAVVAEGTQDRRAAHPQHHFLAQTVVAVAAVQVVGEGLVPRRVLGDRRVEQKDRDFMSRNTADDIAPGANANGTTFYLERCVNRQKIEYLVRLPRYRLLRLRAGSVEML